MLLECLRSAIGLTDSALDWCGCGYFRQNAKDLLQWSTVCSAAGAVWGSAAISTGLLLYILYTVELVLVSARHGLILHLYTDDTRVYISMLVLSASDDEAAVG